VNATIYKGIVGSLEYLCSARTYLAFYVGLINRYVEKPTMYHLLATRRNEICETNTELGSFVSNSEK